jgi:aspartyl-tRNA(Asn)/glutamyl-tRNA(Gln) amidotransferase subunit A
MSYADTGAAHRARPTALAAVEIARLVAARQLGAHEVVQAHLDCVQSLNGALNALVRIDEEEALRTAARLDEAVRHGRPVGPLAGVPFVVKDNVDVHGQETASGSRAHPGLVASADAPVVRRLREAGAILVGRANMDELAMGASTQTSSHGPTRNPVDRRRSPGGSSGGSAAAVAAGFVPLAVGTDTGGSIREPASQCGVLGMAPSIGLVPLDGVVPFAPGLDRVGPLARSAEDMAAMLATLSGHPLAPAAPVRRVAVVEELVSARNRPEVLEAFETWLSRVREHGVEVTRVSIPDAPDALAAYMTLTSVASVDWLEPYVRSELAGEELVRRYHYGLDLRRNGDADIDRARAVQTRLAAEVTASLRTVDALVSPTMPTTAPLLFGEITPEELADPLAAPYTDCWTVVANLAGVPALSVPAPVGGLPVGAMLMGAPGSDADLLALAAATES